MNQTGHCPGETNSVWDRVRRCRAQGDVILINGKEFKEPARKLNKNPHNQKLQGFKSGEREGRASGKCLDITRISPKLVLSSALTRRLM
ncbi:hypothetical protein TNCV_4432091 [Trichonephila clavipes]|nr:hypothetical protein TNCV_4432091 [Trichonephila clavipes]